MIGTTIAKKSSFLRTQAFIFLFALGTPLRQSRKTLHEWKGNSVLAKPLAACIHLSWTVSQLFEPQVQKIAVFTYRSPHFCFPWGRPWGNHAKCCMDGKRIRCLKLSRCMCPSNYNRFWDRARYCSKIVNFFIPLLHSTPPLRGFPLEYRQPVWYGKTRMAWLPHGEKIYSKISLFVLAQLTNVADRRTDGRTPHAGNSRAMHSIARQKC